MCAIVAGIFLRLHSPISTITNIPLLRLLACFTVPPLPPTKSGCVEPINTTPPLSIHRPTTCARRAQSFAHSLRKPPCALPKHHHLIASLLAYIHSHSSIAQGQSQDHSHHGEYQHNTDGSPQQPTFPPFAKPMNHRRHRCHHLHPRRPPPPLLPQPPPPLPQHQQQPALNSLTRSHLPHPATN
jgi:hypothetical protein